MQERREDRRGEETTQRKQWRNRKKAVLAREIIEDMPSLNATVSGLIVIEMALSGVQAVGHGLVVMVWSILS